MDGSGGGIIRGEIKTTRVPAVLCWSEDLLLCFVASSKSSPLFLTQINLTVVCIHTILDDFVQLEAGTTREFASGWLCFSLLSFARFAHFRG